MVVQGFDGSSFSACGGQLVCVTDKYGSGAVTGFDATTSTYTGLVYAYTSCATGGRGGGGSPYIYTGCAATVWDTVGDLVSYSIEWRATGRGSAPPASACLG